MVLFYLILMMHFGLFALGYSTALFLGIRSTVQEMNENRIEIHLNENINYILNFTDIIISKKVIWALIYNKDLRKYLYISIVSGVITMILYKTLNI